MSAQSQVQVWEIEPEYLTSGFLQQNLNVYLASIGTGEWVWSYYTILAMLFVVFFTGAGRSLGLDMLLAKRFGENKWGLW